MVPTNCVLRAVANSWFHVHVEERIEDLRTQTKARRAKQTRTVRTQSQARPSPRRTPQLRLRTGRRLRITDVFWSDGSVGARLNAKREVPDPLAEDPRREGQHEAKRSGKAVEASD
mmetsp:Transcript_11133/g.68567  ORF Transcript_11133/g.68567 Transcript_11133/m.68567 type:complete len:116 (+) Transcript_11133:805-1152(+)